MHIKVYYPFQVTVVASFKMNMNIIEPINWQNEALTDYWWKF